MHRITPIEIRQKRFEKSFRGYNTDEVDAFLHSLAYVWEKLLSRFEEVDKSLRDTQKEVKRLHGIENAILRATGDAETNARSIIEQAREQATLRLREVGMEADKRLQEAQRHIKTLEAEHLNKQRMQEEQMIEKLSTVQKNIQEAEAYRDNLLQKIRYLAEDILIQVRATRDEASNTNIIDQKNDSPKSGYTAREKNTPFSYLSKVSPNS